MPTPEEAVKDLVTRSREVITREMAVQRKLLQNLLAVRSTNAFGLADIDFSLVDLEPDRVRPFEFDFPEHAVNLLHSTSQSLLGSLFPDMPSARAKPVVDLTGELEKHQNDFLDRIFTWSNIKHALRRAIHVTLFDRWCGLKRVVMRNAPLDKRTQFLAIDPGACGWEPHFRRFKWHHYLQQWDAVPDKWKEPIMRAEGSGAQPPNDWDMFVLTEVYLDNFGGEKNKMLVYGSRREQDAAKVTEKDPATTRFEIGNYVTTESIDYCPISVLKFTEPTTQEDVPTSEVVQWLPELDTMTIAKGKLKELVREASSIILVDASAIDIEEIVERTIAGNIKTIVPVMRGRKGTITGDQDTGVSHKMRPVEFISMINDVLQGYLMAKQDFDEISGVASLRRGQVPGEVHPATTTTLADQGADLRNRVRREAIADCLNELAHMVITDQRKVYGTELIVSRDTGVVESIPIPDPKVAKFALRYDAVELGHMSQAVNFENAGTELQVALQVESQGAIGPWTWSAAKDFRRFLGKRDSDWILPRPTTDQDPMKELFLQFSSDQQRYVARPGQNHAAFIAAYRNMLNVLQSEGRNEADPIMLFVAGAILEHQRMDSAGRAASPAQGANLGAGTTGNPGLAAAALGIA